MLLPLELLVKFPLELPLDPCSLYSTLFHLAPILNLNQVSAIDLTNVFSLDQNIDLDLELELDLTLNYNFCYLFCKLEKCLVLK